MTPPVPPGVSTGAFYRNKRKEKQRLQKQAWRAKLKEQQQQQQSHEQQDDEQQQQQPDQEGQTEHGQDEQQQQQVQQQEEQQQQVPPPLQGDEPEGDVAHAERLRALNRGYSRQYRKRQKVAAAAAGAAAAAASPKTPAPRTLRRKAAAAASAILSAATPEFQGMVLTRLMNRADIAPAVHAARMAPAKEAGFAQQVCQGRVTLCVRLLSRLSQYRCKKSLPVHSFLPLNCY